MNRIAASLAGPDTETCLALLHRLAPSIGLAELRLDLMDSFDLPRLIGDAPCPVIITCRPRREGGRFAGSETERLNILAQAMQLGCAYVDLEWDSLDAFLSHRPAQTRTQVIASRHWYDQMPPELWSTYQALRPQAEVVKLVGAAQRPTDIFPVFDLLQRADTPVIAIAMGQAGQLTRLLAPCFASCLLTYAAPTLEAVTAAGQLSVPDMHDIYHLHAVDAQTTIYLHLCPNTISIDRVIAKNALATPGADLYVPLVVSLEEAERVAAGLQATLPHLILTNEIASASPYSALP